MPLMDQLRAAKERGKRMLELDRTEPWLEAERRILREAADPILVSPEGLAAFLERTASMDMPRSERLRRLAIALEHEAFADGWDGLQRIYETAASEDPNALRIFESWGISSTTCRRWDDADLDERRRIFADGEGAFARAVALAPADADAFFHMGLHQYEYPKTERASTEHAVRALPWLARALSIDACHPMAQLYQAHCFHDLRDWPAAVLAYSAVDQGRLLEERPYQGWRVTKLEEQLSFCLAQAGHVAEARRRFVALIEEISELTQEETWGFVVDLSDLEEAARTTFQDDPAFVEATSRVIEHLFPRAR